MSLTQIEHQLWLLLRFQPAPIDVIKINVLKLRIPSHLCIINFQRATCAVDVTPVQVITCPRRRVNRVELDHRLNAILLEYHDAQNGSVRMTNCVNHFLQREKVKNE